VSNDRLPEGTCTSSGDYFIEDINSDVMAAEGINPFTAFTVGANCVSGPRENVTDYRIGFRPIVRMNYFEGVTAINRSAYTS